MRARASTINRSLSWADATFYGACAALVVAVVLINTLSHSEKWVGSKVLDHVPLIAALHHSSYRSVYFVTVALIMNAPFHVLSALAGALVFLIAQRPRSLAYSILIMSPQILLGLISASDSPRPTWLWVATEIAWVVMGVGVFHGLSLAASRAAVVTLGRDVQPTARLLRLLGVLGAIGPALFLALEAHMYFWSGFKPSMPILVPLGALALLLCLTVRYGSRPVTTATIAAAGILTLTFAGELLGHAGN
jgi:hypothetical protein